MLNKIASIEEEIINADQNEGKLKKAIYNLVTAGGKLSPEKEEYLKKLQAAKNMIPVQKQELEKQKQDVEREIEKNQNASIDVKGTVYPGVRINILNKKCNVNKEQQRVSFKLENYEVITAKY